MSGRGRDDGASLVVGATGGIGRALAAALVAEGAGPVHAWSRTGEAPDGTLPGAVDLACEESVARAAATLPADPPLRLVIVATGRLSGPGLSPEKSWRDLDADSLVASFRANVVGPALVAKHLLPLLPRRGRSIFAALSARVGSIGDNRLGGWHGYRASKAALNQLLRTLSIELARTRPDAICLGLHPGTVDTPLSRPFQGSVAPGRLFTPENSAAHLLDVIAKAGPAETGRVLAWDGSTVPP